MARRRRDARRALWLRRRRRGAGRSDPLPSLAGEAPPVAAVLRRTRRARASLLGSHLREYGTRPAVRARSARRAPLRGAQGRCAQAVRVKAAEAATPTLPSGGAPAAASRFRRDAGGLLLAGLRRFDDAAERYDEGARAAPRRALPRAVELLLPTVRRHLRAVASQCADEYAADAADGGADGRPDGGDLDLDLGSAEEVHAVAAEAASRASNARPPPPRRRRRRARRRRVDGSGGARPPRALWRAARAANRARDGGGQARARASAREGGRGAARARSAGAGGGAAPRIPVARGAAAHPPRAPSVGVAAAPPARTTRARRGRNASLAGGDRRHGSLAAAGAAGGAALFPPTLLGAVGAWERRRGGRGVARTTTTTTGRCPCRTTRERRC